MKNRNLKAELLKPVDRWGYLHKAFLCDGIRVGTITIAEAMEAHRLSVDELTDWYDRYNRMGIAGLRKFNRNRKHAA